LRKKRDMSPRRPARAREADSWFTISETSDVEQMGKFRLYFTAKYVKAEKDEPPKLALGAKFFDVISHEHWYHLVKMFNRGQLIRVFRVTCAGVVYALARIYGIKPDRILAFLLPILRECVDRYAAKGWRDRILEGK